jgi:hypothetical protein
VQQAWALPSELRRRFVMQLLPAVNGRCPHLQATYSKQRAAPWGMGWGGALLLRTVVVVVFDKVDEVRGRPAGQFTQL